MSINFLKHKTGHKSDSAKINLCAELKYISKGLYTMMKNILKIEHSVTFICFKQQFATIPLVHTAVKQIQLQT